MLSLINALDDGCVIFVLPRSENVRLRSRLTGVSACTATVRTSLARRFQTPLGESPSGFDSPLGGIVKTSADDR